jgi:hypothetical protein
VCLVEGRRLCVLLREGGCVSCCGKVVVCLVEGRRLCVLFVSCFVCFVYYGYYYLFLFI